MQVVSLKGKQHRKRLTPMVDRCVTVQVEQCLYALNVLNVKMSWLNSVDTTVCRGGPTCVRSDPASIHSDPLAILTFA